MVAALATSPYATTIRHLTIGLGNHGAVAALARGRFDAVSSIALTRWPVDIDTVAVARMYEALPKLDAVVMPVGLLPGLARAPFADQIRELTLDVSGGVIDHRDVERFHRLEVLRIARGHGRKPTFELLGELGVRVELAPNLGPVVDGSVMGDWVTCPDY
jgi:hypothetical protein